MSRIGGIQAVFGRFRGAVRLNAKKIKFLSQNANARGYSIMIALFLNLLDTPAEKEKFTALYTAYKDLLYWIALQKTHKVEDAEECVQETFFYVAKHFEKIGEVNAKNTKCYLSAVVTGFAIDAYKTAQTASLAFDEADDTDDLVYFENFESAELQSVFDGVLDEESKIYLYLKYVYRYKSSEIAEMYSVQDAYVRKKLQRAKEKLKQCLEKGHEDAQI